MIALARDAALNQNGSKRERDHRKQD